MQIDTLLSGKDNPKALAAVLTAEEIDFLVSLLSQKADDIRYAAFLTLCSRSELNADVYPYWDVFVQKMNDANSYQRNIGLTLIAHNVKWDTQGRFPVVFEQYLSHCQDEKFVTSRLAIQSIPLWVEFAPGLLITTAEKLMGIDIASLKDTQQKLTLSDILHALLAIRRVKPQADIDAYIHQALTGGFLDKKAVKQIQGLL